MSKSDFGASRYFIPFTGPWTWTWIDGTKVQSNLPWSLMDLAVLELEKQVKITALIQDRVRSQKRLLITSVQDRREDQPAVLFQVGASRSRAVCRIVRYFSRQDFQIFIETILKIIAEKPEIAENFDSIAKLKEIFLIPDEIAGAIYDEVMDALKSLPQDLSPQEHSLKCSGILLGGLKDLEEHQLAQLNPISVGSGFLVGATHLLTNYHVLFDEEVARQCVAQFNYEESLGISQKQIDYELDPDALFIQEPSLDYALVQLKFNQLTRQAGHNFGWLQLIEDDSNILPDISNDQYILTQLEAEGYVLSPQEQKGDNVILIHHPKGRQKKVDLTNNRVAPSGLYKQFLRYQGESDYGSSGCPVFNTKWELVALNHAAIPQKDKTFIKQGIRICAIVEDLKQKAAVSPKLRSFIKDFVITSEQLKYPPLPAALGLNGVNDYIQINSTNTSTSQSFSVEVWVNLTGQQEKTTIFTAFCQEDWAEEESTLGDVVLHCYLTPEGELVVARKKVFSSYPTSSLLYPASRLDLFYPKRYPAPPSLRVGEKGDQVKAFKQFFSLIPGLALNLETTDKFSEKDAEVIKKFQENRHDRNGIKLEQDGIVGYKTLDALWREVHFEQDNTPNPAIKDIRYLLTLIHDGLEESFPESILEVLRQPSEVFCEQTRAAIKHFQKDQKLRETGVIDSITLDALWIYGLYLRKGNQAQAVKDLQFLLNHVGHEVPNSGIFDSDTEKAVKKFQERNRVGVDGIVGKRTLDVLIKDRSYTYELRAQKFDWFVTPDFIRKFQRDHDLTPDGLPNPVTVKQMEKESNLRPGVYNHVAVTYDGQATIHNGKMIRLLVNGKELEFSKPGNADLAKRNDLLKLSNAPTPFLIGAYAEVVERIVEDRSCHFQGSLAELRIWNCDRAQQIEADLKSEKKQKTRAFSKRLNSDESGLIGYWRFEESDAYQVPEAPESENQVPMIRQLQFKVLLNRATDKELSAILFFREKPRSVLASDFPALSLPFGLEFKEKKDTVEIPNVEFHKDKAEAITLEAWVRYTFGNGFILYQKDENGNGFCLGFNDERLLVEFQGGKKLTKIEMESRFPTDTIWHHVAVILNAKSEIWLYVDGRAQLIVVVQAEKAESIATQDRRVAIGKFQASINVKDTPLSIGKREREENYFHIAISEVRIWKLARTPEQIKKFQFYPLSGNEPGLVGYWRLNDGGQDNLIRDSSTYKRHGSSNHPKNWYPLPSSL